MKAQGYCLGCSGLERLNVICSKRKVCTDLVFKELAWCVDVLGGLASLASLGLVSLPMVFAGQ